MSGAGLEIESYYFEIIAFLIHLKLFTFKL
jgi:hypothetical protein